MKQRVHSAGKALFSFVSICTLALALIEWWKFPFRDAKYDNNWY